jgi:hypothetical protein
VQEEEFLMVHESGWQGRLLPFMVGTLGVLTLFFCAMIAWETYYIQSRMENAGQIDLRKAAMEEFRTNAPFLLEADIIERRYHQASVAAMGRIYLVFLGFATGMVMALVGATFVLGKIREKETAIDGEAHSVKASLRSGSPGVILAFLGTVLMLSTIFSRTEISVTDQAVYLGHGPESTALEPDVASKPVGGARKMEPKEPSDKSMSKPATEDALEAKADNPQAGVHAVMGPAPAKPDGDYALEYDSNQGTLSIRGHEAGYTGRDGKKKQVQVKLMDGAHLAFTVVEPDGGRQEFDGYLTPENNIVGSTWYQGSHTSVHYGFTARKIKQK